MNVFTCNYCLLKRQFLLYVWNLKSNYRIISFVSVEKRKQLLCCPETCLHYHRYCNSRAC